MWSDQGKKGKDTSYQGREPALEPPGLQNAILVLGKLHIRKMLPHFAVTWRAGGETSHPPSFSCQQGTDTQQHQCQWINLRSILTSLECLMSFMMVGLIVYPWEGVKFGNFTLCHRHTFNLHLWPWWVWNSQLLASLLQPSASRGASACILCSIASAAALHSPQLCSGKDLSSVLALSFSQPNSTPPPTELPVLPQSPWHNLGQLSYLISDGICRLTCGTRGPRAFLSNLTHPSSLCGFWAPSLGAFSVPSARDSDLHLDNHTYLWAAF